MRMSCGLVVEVVSNLYLTVNRMYSNIFESSVILSNIAFSFDMYSDIDVPLVEAINDFYGFIADMNSI